LLRSIDKKVVGVFVRFLSAPLQWAMLQYPGLPGVGEVTAKKLLKEFGTMENLLATDKLKVK
jgi:NAD-dependent DNA ligase